MVYGGVRLDRTCQPDIPANDRMMADVCFAAQDCGSRVDNNMIANCRVAFYIGKHLIHTQGPQGYTLIKFHIITDGAGFADNQSGAMVNMQMMAYCCSRMDINSRFGMRMFCQYARYQRNTQAM